MSGAARAAIPHADRPSGTVRDRLADAVLASLGESEGRARERPPRLAVSWAEAMRANTGVTFGAESWQEGRDRQAVLREQTGRLVEALERSGITARVPSSLVAVGDVTGAVERLEGWRRIRFLPLVAQAERRPMVNALKLFQRQPGGEWLRYAVITSGERVPLLGDLKSRQRDHTRRVSRWASESLRDWGVAVLLRATEFTVTPEGIHLHSNILYRPLRRLAPERWKAFLSWSAGRLGTHWEDAGVVRDMAEVVKYAIKPSELEGQPDEVIAWLATELFRAKLVQPMGPLKEWLAGLDSDRLKVCMVRQGGVSTLRLVQRPQVDPVEPREECGPPPENVLVARLLPVARFTPWAEPVSLVLHYQPDPVTTGGKVRLDILGERSVQARQWWDESGAPDPATISVHTVQPTVQPAGTSGDSESGNLSASPVPCEERARCRSTEFHSSASAESSLRVVPATVRSSRETVTMLSASIASLSTSMRCEVIAALAPGRKRSDSSGSACGCDPGAEQPQVDY